MKMKTTEQFIKEYYEKFPESTVEIVGEYVGKTYMETKERPRFIIQDEI